MGFWNPAYNLPRGETWFLTGEATQLLALWANGDTGAGERLWPLVYDDLRHIARRHLADERAGHTLDPTALVHEAWMQIGPEHARGASGVPNRSQYLAFASRVMRSYLVDHARRKGADKRGGRQKRVTLAGVVVDDTGQTDVLTVHDMLDALSAADEELGRIAELRIFGGMTQNEIAEVVGLPKRTLERRWRIASAWLRRELER